MASFFSNTAGLPWSFLGKDAFHKYSAFPIEWPFTVPSLQPGYLTFDGLHIAAAPNGGPIAMCRRDIIPPTNSPLPDSFYTATASGNPFTAPPSRDFEQTLRIFSSSGKLVSEFYWPHQDVLAIGWTYQETLAVIIRDGSVFVYNIHGRVLLHDALTFPDNVITTVNMAHISPYGIICTLAAIPHKLLYYHFYRNDTFTLTDLPFDIQISGLSQICPTLSHIAAGQDLIETQADILQADPHIISDITNDARFDLIPQIIICSKATAQDLLELNGIVGSSIGNNNNNNNNNNNPNNGKNNVVKDSSKQHSTTTTTAMSTVNINQDYTSIYIITRRGQPNIPNDIISPHKACLPSLAIRLCPDPSGSFLAVLTQQYKLHCLSLNTFSVLFDLKVPITMFPPSTITFCGSNSLLEYNHGLRDGYDDNTEDDASTVSESHPLVIGVGKNQQKLTSEEAKLDYFDDLINNNNSNNSSQPYCNIALHWSHLSSGPSSNTPSNNNNNNNSSSTNDTPSNNSLTLIVGPNQRFLSFSHPSQSYLIGQSDYSLNVLTQHSLELIECIHPSILLTLTQGSDHPAAQLLASYLQHSARSYLSSDAILRHLQTTGQLGIAVQTLLDAAAYHSYHPVQITLLSASRYGRLHLGSPGTALLLRAATGRGDANGDDNAFQSNTASADEFVDVCKQLRLSHQLWQTSVGIPLTYQLLHSYISAERVILRMTSQQHHGLAVELCRLLNISADLVVKDWCMTKLLMSDTSTTSTSASSFINDSSDRNNNVYDSEQQPFVQAARFALEYAATKLNNTTTTTTTTTATTTTTTTTNAALELFATAASAAAAHATTDNGVGGDTSKREQKIISDLFQALPPLQRIILQIHIKLHRCKTYSYAPIALWAAKFNSLVVSISLAHFEPVSAQQTALFLSLREFIAALRAAYASYDHDLLIVTIYRLIELYPLAEAVNLLHLFPDYEHIWLQHCLYYDYVRYEEWTASLGYHSMRLATNSVVGNIDLCGLTQQLTKMIAAATSNSTYVQKQQQEVMTETAQSISELDEAIKTLEQSASSNGIVPSNNHETILASAAEKCDNPVLTYGQTTFLLGSTKQLYTIQQRYVTDGLLPATHVGMSVIDTIKYMYATNHEKEVRGMASAFSISSTRLAYAQIQALIETNNWHQLQQQAPQLCHQIGDSGYDFVIEMCLHFNAPSQANRYVKLLDSYLRQLYWLCHLRHFADAAQIAFENKDIEALHDIRQAGRNDPNAIAAVDRFLQQLQ